MKLPRIQVRNAGIMQCTDNDPTRTGPGLAKSHACNTKNLINSAQTPRGSAEFPPDLRGRRPNPTESQSRALGTPTHSTRAHDQTKRRDVPGDGGGEGLIGYLDAAVARAAEHDLLEAGGALDELRERRRQLWRLRRRWGGGASGARGGHLATRPGDGGAVNLTLGFLLRGLASPAFRGFI